jgi:two-component system chemotaxis sensor kinase CheA
MDDLITEFIAESREMLEALEQGLVAWERDPSDRALLDEIFRFVHTVKGNCGFFDLPRLERLAHAAEDALGNVRLGRRSVDTRLVDAVLAVIDRIGEMIEVVAAGDDISQGNDDALLAMLAAADEDASAPVAEVVEGATQSALKPARGADASRTVRLQTSLVDRVMSGVSDMILVRNEIERQMRLTESDPALMANFGRLSALLSDMQSAMAQARMQPIGTLLASYQRMVRDLTAELGKQVEFEVESGQVELDREMIELLRDPLLHIVRNAIDHGIETPCERVAAGKRACGRLMLSARQTGNEIRIAVLDDGRGIDAESVVAKAVARGVITEDQAARMDQDQKLALICEAGLSTAAEVTQISGRGVGMDVVRASIERIGGKLRIVSTPGDGCRILLDVPLTLSIVPSITVEAGGQTFAVPRSYVREIVRNSAAIEVDAIGGLRHVEVRGDLHPCVELAGILGLTPAIAPADQILVMLKMIDGAVFALAVDAIADHCELVIRPVAQQVIATGFYVGVAQLNDGQPALMLDVAGVSRFGGLTHDQQTRVSADRGNSHEVALDLVPVILFDGLDGIRRAVAMDRVERLIEVKAAEIGYGAGRPHIVFNDEILPIHGISAGFSAEVLEVLVIAAGGTRLAQAAAGSIDTVEVDMTTCSGEPGSRLVLVNGQPVEVLEPGVFAEAGVRGDPLCRLPLDDPWCRDVLRPLVESAGYRVTDEGDGPVDLEIVMEEGGVAPEPRGAARVLVIGDEPRAVRAETALSRNDHAALIAAVRASRGRA